MYWLISSNKAILSQSLIQLLHVVVHFPQRLDRTLISELRFVFPYHIANGIARYLAFSRNSTQTLAMNLIVPRVFAMVSTINTTS